MIDFNIITPDGRGTIVGMSPDHKRILVMHTHKERKGTYAMWWDWDDKKGEIIGRTESSGSDKENYTEG